VGGLLLVLILRGQPVAREPIVARLTTLARGAAGREIAAGLLLNAAPARLAQALDRIASNANTRVIAATPEGEILYDSLGHAQRRDGGRFPAGAAGAGWADNLLEGSFQEAGQEWLIVGDHFETRQVDAVLLFAAPRPESSWREVLRLFGTSVLLPLLEAGAVGLLVALLMAWLTTRGTVRALYGLREAAGEIAAGNYAERVPVAGPDEVRDVATAFNDMAAQVQANQAAQQDFLANVSHDLRTPLTSIQGFSQAIIDGASKDPAYHARIIVDEAGRLNRLVGELLDLARISSGRLSMHQGRVDVGPIAAAVAERLTIRAREAGIQLVQDIQPAPEVTGDGDRLAQVLTNLIDNAIKFTPQGGAVRVAVGPGGGGVRIAVSDTGQGIPREDLPRVFERFTRSIRPRPPARDRAGAGDHGRDRARPRPGASSPTEAAPARAPPITVWLPAIGMSRVARPGFVGRVTAPVRRASIAHICLNRPTCPHTERCDLCCNRMPPSRLPSPATEYSTPQSTTHTAITLLKQIIPPVM
jgi:signal transduction histidine kinase